MYKHYVKFAFNVLWITYMQTLFSFANCNINSLFRCENMCLFTFYCLPLFQKYIPATNYSIPYIRDAQRKSSELNRLHVFA